MRWVRMLFLASAALMVLGTWLVWKALPTTNSTQSTSLIASAALVAASAGWLFNNGMTSYLKIREQTLNYLKHATEGLVLTELAANLTAEWKTNELDRIFKSTNLMDEFCRDNYPDAPIFKTLRIMANHYEQMAIAIKCGAVEERMLRLFFATTLDWFFHRLTPFLPWFRNYPVIEGHPFGQKSIPDVFSHCVWLANRWDGKEGS